MKRSLPGIPQASNRNTSYLSLCTRLQSPVWNAASQQMCPRGLRSDPCTSWLTTFLAGQLPPCPVQAAFHSKGHLSKRPHDTLQRPPKPRVNHTNGTDHQDNQTGWKASGGGERRAQGASKTWGWEWPSPWERAALGAGTEDTGRLTQQRAGREGPTASAAPRGGTAGAGSEKGVRLCLGRP